MKYIIIAILAAISTTAKTQTIHFDTTSLAADTFFIDTKVYDTIPAVMLVTKGPFIVMRYGFGIRYQVRYLLNGKPMRRVDYFGGVDWIPDTSPFGGWNIQKDTVGYLGNDYRPFPKDQTVKCHTFFNWKQ
jgi:hypothetical protein